MTLLQPINPSSLVAVMAFWLCRTLCPIFMSYSGLSKLYAPIWEGHINHRPR